jgi:hypothetical protein
MKTNYHGLAILALVGLFSCSSKGSKENEAQPWKEMETFSATMEKAFRPLKDSSSVSEVEKMMAQIADEAETLFVSPLPEKMNNEEARKNLEKLKTDTRSLANEISSGTEDDVIGTDFYKIHDLFLEIKGTWEK